MENINGYVLQDNISYTGTTIKPITNIKNSNDIKKCSDVCDKDKTCTGFVYNDDNNTCYLRTNFNVESKKSDPNAKTYFKNNIQSKLPSAIIKVGEQLQEGQVKYSDNREYFLILENDGQLGIFNQNETKLWSSGPTASGSSYLIMQADGNLSIYNKTSNNKNVWSTKSNGLDRTHASIDNDGVLRVWNKLNQIVWSSSNSPKLPIQTIPSGIITMDYDYKKGTSPIFVIGDYGIAPWGKKSSSFASSSGSQNVRTAKWIWYTQNANTLSPPNTNPITIQYVYMNNSGIELNINLYMMIDNNCDVYLNSKLFKSNLSGGWTENPILLRMIVAPGSNLFEFNVKSSGGPAGLIVAARTEGTGPDNDQLLFCSDKTWKFIPLQFTPINICNLSQTGLITNTDKSFPYGSLTLNGTFSQYVKIGTTITEMNGLSFGCWFKSDKNKTHTRIFDFGNGQSSDNIVLFINDNNLYPSVFINGSRNNVESIPQNINDNNWYHFVWTIEPTFNSSGLAPWSIYLNGRLILRTLGNYPSNISRTECYLGKSNWKTDPYFKGSMSNFVMYQKVLSVNEITALYNSMINTMDPTLYIYLPFSSNAVLDTILNNFAGRQFSLPIKISDIKNENWNCLQEGKNWISVKMQNSQPVCMSVDGKNCIVGSESECVTRNTNPAMPQNPVVCNNVNAEESWCPNAKKILSPNLHTNQQQSSQSTTPSSANPNAVAITDIRPTVAALSALQTNSEDESINLKPLTGGGRVLSIGTMGDVNKLLVGGVFKLRVNLPMMPPYIKGKNFDTNVGTNPNYFYLSVEKLDNNCSIKAPNGNCLNVYADNKNCSSKALTSYVQTNSYRLVLISSQYVLDPSIPIGKNSDFTLVNIGGQVYLKNVQTGYLPSLHSFDSNILVHGDMQINSNTNVNTAQSTITNVMCGQETPQVQTTGTKFIRCNVQADPSDYLITTKNFGESSPVRININQDKTISINLLEFNKYGNATKIYALTYCNFNVNTFSFIEKMTNTLGTFLVNMVCFADTQDSKLSTKNQLKFTVELVSFPPNFIKDNSIYDI